ncbi:MAG: TonB-dependent receptor, partial [Sulfurimonas sp.]|nr:TonB-dependent receptor [Sulfurimonas sp.]
LLAKDTYYADEANEFKQDGYEVVNLRVNYKFTENLEIFGSIDNLFDTTYYEFVNVSSASIDKTMEDATIRVSPGREYYVGLRAKF